MADGGWDERRELHLRPLLRTDVLSVTDVACRGDCRHRAPSECATETHLVFPYRGVFAHHVGRRTTVGEANRLLFLHAGEEYAISHPTADGDDCLSVAVEDAVLRELLPASAFQPGPRAWLCGSGRRLDAASQRLVALLRFRLTGTTIEPLEAESAVLDLVARACATEEIDRTVSFGRAHIADRAKAVIAAAPSRRWTLAEIAADVGVSAVHLTQCFRAAEGSSLHEYQTALRLAHALDRLPTCDDITALALDLGFSSHSHFSAVFRRVHGCTPASFRATARLASGRPLRPVPAARASRGTSPRR